MLFQCQNLDKHPIKLASSYKTMVFVRSVELHLYANRKLYCDWYNNNKKLYFSVMFVIKISKVIWKKKLLHVKSI